MFRSYFLKQTFLFLIIYAHESYRYTPPEIHLGLEHTIESDIFSLSTLMWSVSTLEIPFNELGTFSKVN
jgi:hypothetical protein